MKEGYRGYIFSRSINDQIIPQRIQTAVIRDFSDKTNKLFLLSAVEYNLENCFMMLRSMIDDLLDIKGIIFYSTFQLPEDINQRKEIINKMLTSNREIHFALEELSVYNQESASYLEDLLMVRRLTKHTNNMF